jgi:hypothetical protein
LGRQFKKGACTSPLFLFLVRSSIARVSARTPEPIYAGITPCLNHGDLILPLDIARWLEKIAPEKGERPVGVPAARAWGWREM